MPLNDSDKLDELLELTRENNAILRKVRRNMFWSSVGSVVYWLVLLGAMGWAYYLAQPYLDTLMAAYAKVSALGAGAENGAKVMIDPAILKGLLGR